LATQDTVYEEVNAVAVADCWSYAG